MLTIILPVYNESRYLPDLFECLTNQTLKDWEAVIVNDGSTDNTATIAREWARRDSRIRIIDPSTKLGKVAAFNLAFKESSGDHVCHIGGDDLLPNNGLERRALSLKGAPELAVSFGKFRFMNAAGELIGRSLPRGSHGSQSSAGATYSRALADLIFPIPDDLPTEDIWLGNAARACSTEIRHIPDTILHYRQHDSNSNPRMKPFAEMNESIAMRMRAYHHLLNSELPIPEEYRREYIERIATEELRTSGKTLSLLLRKSTRTIDRLALASMSDPRLWQIRKRIGHLASGWRGR